MDKRETRARYVEFAGTKGTVSILCCRFILKGIVSGFIGCGRSVFCAQLRLVQVKGQIETGSAENLIWFLTDMEVQC